ncbi:hypothetical protein CL634_05645, partial [bacterium]|nr:hypothetical protein [bacterium]
YVGEIKTVPGLFVGNGGTTDGVSNGTSSNTITSTVGTGIVPGQTVFSVGTTTWIDDGAGGLLPGVTGDSGTPSGGSVTYATGAYTLTWSAGEPAVATPVNVQYHFTYDEAVFHRCTVNGFLVGQGVVDKALLPGDLTPGLQLSTTNVAARKIILKGFSIREITSLSDTLYSSQRISDPLSEEMKIRPDSGISGSMIIDSNNDIWTYDNSKDPYYWESALKDRVRQQDSPATLLENDNMILSNPVGPIILTLPPNPAKGTKISVHRESPAATVSIEHLSGAVTSTSAGSATTIASTNHGLQTGAIITISGTTSYNGTVTVTVIDDDSFDIPTAFAGAEAGTWLTQISGVDQPDVIAADTSNAYMYTGNRYIKV